MKKLFLLGIMIPLLSACSDNSNDSPSVGGKTGELKINANIVAPKSRAQKDDWSGSDKIGIYVCKDVISVPYDTDPSYVNAEFTYSTNDWNSQSILLGQTEATLFAYYPYNNSLSNPTSVPIEIESQTDYMYGKSTEKASFTKKRVDVNMLHALTQVVFSVKKSSDYSGAGVLSKIQLLNLDGKSNLYTTGTLNISDGSVTNITKGDIQFLASGTLTTTATDYTSIVMPVQATATEEIKALFTIDGKELQYTFPTGTTWAAGTKNIYKISLGSNGLQIGDGSGNGVTIKPWGKSESDIELIPII